jgi:hypothetical protein
MKKILSLMLALFVSVAILACNLNTTTTTTTSLSTTSATSLSTTTTTSESTTTTTESTTTTTTTATYQYQPMEIPQVAYNELYNSFLFFYEAVNSDPASSGYGMITDRMNPVTRAMGAASIASVGFGLAALPIGIENSWITYQEGYDRTLGTIATIEGMQRTHGFFYHFVNMSNARRAGGSEVSIIDTAILLCGLIMAGEYFGGEIKTRVNAIYQAVEWDWYFNTNRQMFYMGYQPETGFGGAWDYYGEQLMIYLLAAASDNYAIGKTAYTVMKNRTPKRSYGTSGSFYASWFGTLFTYQYSHAFFDFRNLEDEQGVDWFDNSVQASIAAYDYGTFLQANYTTYGTTGWGNTSSDGPDGYAAYGNLPAGGTIDIDGTLAPAGPIGSLPFVPNLVLPAMDYFSTIYLLQSRYGFKDAFNLGVTASASASIIRPNATIPGSGWFAPDVIGIDKGITVLMIENYRSGFVWEYFMRSEIVQKGFDELGFQPK